MGLYTELILGCSLDVSSPKIVIDTLKWMIYGDGESEIPSELPQHPFFTNEETRIWMLRSSSYYFGVCECVNRMWYDNIGGRWIISSRSNVKNYNKEIEMFLDWLKPYIRSGSGSRDFYAIVCYESAEEPTIYYIN